MRTIKFRAWDDGKKEWLLGYEYPNLGGFSMDGECVLMGEWANVCTSFMFENNNRKRSDLKLMQFTGLKDKNGKEIYEDDILKIKGFKESWKTKVRFENGGFCIDVEEQDYNITLLGFLDDEAIVEVIGNIYQNPELLSVPTAVL